MLRNDQKKARTAILDWWASEKPHFVLSGKAGSGKTYLIQSLLRELNLKVLLVAPTHKAKEALQGSFDDIPCVTTHKLLGLRPGLHLEDFDTKDPKFVQGRNGGMRTTKYDLLIHDECSMLKDPLYERLCQVNNRILFVGDRAQAKPVKQAEASKVFEIEDRYFMEEVIRTNNNTILAVCDAAREGKLHPKDFPEICVAPKVFGYEYPAEDYTVIPYTNLQVYRWNKFVKNKSNPSEEKIAVNDRVMFYETIRDADGIEDIFKNGEARVVNYMDGDTVYFDNGERIRIVQPHEEEWYIKESVRLIKKAKHQYHAADRAKAWRNYFDFKRENATMQDYDVQGEFLKKTFDLGYAITAHKSQGQSIPRVAVDYNDIMSYPELAYVAVSRAQDELVLLTK